MKTALVTTTINLPHNLESYFSNFRENGFTDVETIVIGDLKSPSETGAYLENLQKQTGYPISYWDVERQKKWLKDLPELDGLLPYNSVQRRNLGYLQAGLLGAKCIISIDDDNFATEQDYLGGHGIIGQTIKLKSVSSENSWFNPSSILETLPRKPLYHRGFPTSKRGESEKLQYSSIEGRVVVNAGMWLEVPDADAMSHLDCPVRVLGFNEGFAERLAVEHGTCTVFNSQNTSFHKDLLPAMFLMPMGDYVGNLMVGRYDDIWMGIFIKYIADHLDDYVCFGIPLAKQMRNDHDLLADLLVELPAMRITNKLVTTLDSLDLSAKNYAGCYRELTEHLKANISGGDYSADEFEYLSLMLKRMSTWSDICQSLFGDRI